MDNEWIMCESGIYPAGIPDEDPEETYEEKIEVLILEHDGEMRFACYYPAGDISAEFNENVAHWEDENRAWRLEDIVCWRHKPAPPPCMEK